MKLLLLLLLLLSAACSDRGPAEPAADAARPVRILQLEASGRSATLTFPALLRARESVQLAFDVPGTIQVMDVTEGRAVETGTLLASLDPSDFISRLNAARAAAELAQADLARFEQLRGSVAEAEIERRRAAATAAASDLEAAENALQNTMIRAPFDGVVSRRLVQNFTSIQAKQPVLLFQALSPLDVVVDIPEPLMLRVRPGTGEQAEAFLRFDGLPNQRLKVTFREVATVADPVTQTFAVVFTLDRPADMTILPGMSATLEVENIIDPGEDFFLLPPAAIAAGADATPFVWVFDTAAGTVARRTVTLGRPRSQGIEVLSGLEAGESVVTSGLAQLREGMRVRPLTTRDREL